MSLPALRNYATGKLTLYSYCISMGLYFFMVLYSIPLVSAHASGMKLFDVSLTGYSFDYAMSLLEQLGSEGRGLYLSLQLPLDFLYPVTYGLSHALVIIWFLDKTRITSPSAFYSCLIPIVGCLFDYCENFTIYHMLASYPNVSEGIVQLASTLTMIKTATVIVTYLLICALLAKVIAYRRNSGNNDTSG